MTADAFYAYFKPYQIMLEDLRKSKSKENIKVAIKTVKAYFYSQNIPHDYGLYEKALNELKAYVEKHFPIQDYPEYWL